MKLEVADLLSEVASRLKHIDSPRKEAMLLLAHYLAKDQLWVVTNLRSSVEVGEEFFALVKRREEYEPLEYITKKVSFYSREFFVDKGVLIPRPETELLIDEVLKNLPDLDAKVRFCEVGVGSGIVSVMLALLYKNATILAVDLSNEALKIAKKNAKKFGVEDRVEFRHSDLLSEVGEKIDYLVSNPPYIADDFELEPNLSYEPREALFGGEVGDEMIKKLLDEVLRRDINLFSCEMGYDQKDKIATYINTKPHKNISFYRDYSGFDRGFTLRLS